MAVQRATDRREFGPLDRQAAATEALLHVKRVLALDELWTVHLTTAAAGDVDPQPASVAALGERLLELLEALPEQLDSVSRALEAASEDEVRDAVRVVTQEHPDAVEALESAAADRGHPGEMRELFRESCELVGEALPDELELLGSKIRRADGGDVPDPDISHGVRCLLSLTGVAAGVAGAVAGAVAGGGIPLALLGIYGDATGLILGWKETRCPQAWKSLRARLGR